MKLAWNAIVRNEAARIERCVQSLLPVIDGALIVDTGSTDGTQQLLVQLFEMAGKPLGIFQRPFENFSQARNEALRVARESKLDWDYLLLVDADMELVGSLSIEGLDGLSYDMLQRVNSLEYYNRRLVSRRATGWYQGVTHEYLDIDSAGTVNGAWFRDHADGANRPDKFVRDIALLEEALKTETRPGLIQRYEFYLAQSYFDSKNWAKAAEHYRKRTQLGGYEEEVWNAQVHLAHCLDNLGDKPGFLWEMLQAYGLRPIRSETLYDLAKYFRERGQNHVSMLFSEPGMRVDKPRGDQLFVNSYVYDHGLKEEFSICAFYDPLRRQRGALLTNQLALDPNANREQARNNLYWYLEPLLNHVPSFGPKRILFPEYEGYVPMNPSVIDYNGDPLVLVRTVNYRITEEGRYAIRSADGNFSGDGPIDTRNWLCRLDGVGNADWVKEIGLPRTLSRPPAFPLVTGFEDSRLFPWRQGLWTLSTVRELDTSGCCRQVLSQLAFDQGDVRYADNWSTIDTKPPLAISNEKNWMPWVRGEALDFVYRLGTVVNVSGEIVSQHAPDEDVTHISGGSQVIHIGEKLYLALVHEARTIPGKGTRYYSHRFALFYEDGRVVGLSRAFYFHDRQIEFAAGLALFNKKLMVSYGVRDCEAWVATMNLGDVLRFVYE